MPHRAIRMTEHRDRPLPSRPWAMSMRWTDLLFMHWPVEPGVVGEAVPGDFDVDLYDGKAWVGVVPFKMQSTRPRLLPPIPQKIMPVSPSSFPELNVRTYVMINVKENGLTQKLPGVLFFSLDAASKLSVRMARLGFNLPYFDAKMKVQQEPGDNGWTHYQSNRTHYGAPPAHFAASYRPKPIKSVYRKAEAPAEPGTEANARLGKSLALPKSQPDSIEHFLTERYRLFTLGRKGRGVRIGEIAHQPWPLQPAECDLSVCEMTTGLGFDLPNSEPILHYADQLDVVAWLPSRA
ncbi:MAG: YqjF family protein [Phycisphaeraceae bacterium]